jgi:predicted transcriptional regulator
MKRLTAKEEEIMEYFWEKGPLFVKELLDFYSEPKPHFNTLSTIVRGLEEKGFLFHQVYGNTHQYHVAVSGKNYRNGALKNVVDRYYNHSYLSVVSSLIKEEDISVEELRQLLDEVEQANK